MVTSTSALPGTTILNLQIANTLDGDEYVPIVQGGTTKRTRAANITTIFSTPGGILTGALGQMAVYASSASVVGSSYINASAGTVTLGVPGAATGSLVLASSAGAITTYLPSTASVTLNSPQTSTTLIGDNTTNVLTGKSFDTAGSSNTLKIGGTTISTASNLLDTLGSSQGRILYRSSTAWTTLTAGTSAQVLQGGSTPSWVTNRIVLTADITLWVRSDGNDANSGTANNAGGAKLTWNALYLAAVTNYDFNGHTVTLKSGTTNTYAGGISMDVPFVGGGTLVIDLAGSSIAETTTKGINCNVRQSGGITIQNTAPGSLGVGGAISSTVGAGIQMSAPGSMGIGAGITMGTCFDAAFEVTQGGIMALTNPVNSTGAGGNAFVLASTNSNFGFNGVTINIQANATYSTGFINAVFGGVVFANSAVFSLGGFTVTGPRFAATDQGSIYTGGAGASFLPGTTNGIVASGGNYDNTVGGYSNTSGAFSSRITSVNFNSSNTDNAVPITLPNGFTRYLVLTVSITHASTTLTTSTWGLYSGAGATGVVLSSTGANTVNTAAANTANNAQTAFLGANAALNSSSVPSVFFRIGTPQGSAATADVTVNYFAVP